MTDRHVSAIKILSPRSLLCFFMSITTIFALSWFSLLRSTGRIHFSGLPYPNFFPSSKNSNFLSQIQTTVTSFATPKCQKPVLKVFMYDLPHHFHFGLLDWKPQKGDNTVWPDITAELPEYPGGLYSQHSVEFWLTLDLLASELPKPLHGGSAIRVRNSSEADVVFVPFFSSMSYNRYGKFKTFKGERNVNDVLQENLVKYVTAQKEWKRFGGRDHLILAHHPNSMLEARYQLWPATFILADFGRYPSNVANVKKDVIAPYKHLVASYVDDHSEFDRRPTLLYFQGAVYRKDVSFSFLLVFCSCFL